MGVSTDETAKTEAACHSRSGTIKMPPCHKAISAEQRAYTGNGLAGRRTLHNHSIMLRCKRSHCELIGYDGCS